MYLRKCLSFFVLLFILEGIRAQSINWEQLPGPFGGRISDAAQVGNIWYLGTGSGVFKSTDAGENWTRLYWVPQHESVVGLDIRPGEILVGTTAPDFLSSDPSYEKITLLHRSTDEGQNWTIDTIEDNSTYLEDVTQVFRQRNYLFACGYGFLLRSGDNGHTWVTTPTSNYSIENIQHNDSILIGTSQFVGLRYSRNGGASWHDVPSPPSGFLSTSAGLGKGSSVFAFNGVNQSYKSLNLGASWQLIGNLSGIQASKEFANGDLAAWVKSPLSDKMLFTSSGGGLNWQGYDGSPYANPVDVLHNNDNTYGVATDNGFYKNIASGNFLNPSDAGITAANVKSLAIYGDQILAGSANGLWRSFDAGANWIPAFPQTQLAGTVRIKQTGNTLCALTDENFYYSTDGGDSWISPFINVWSITHPFNGGRSTDMAVEGDDILVTNENDLFISNDFGQSWTENYSFLTSGVLIVQGKYFVVSKNEGIFRSDDKGLTWTVVKGGNLGDGQFYVLNNTIFAALLSGVYFSTDLGQTWQSSTGLPTYGQQNHNLPVGAMIANDSVMYAGVQFAGIYQSKDGGMSWQLFSTNLPNPRFNDLLLKDNVLYAACVDGGIWTYNLAPVGTQTPERARAISVLPNPTRDGDIRISWSEKWSGALSVEVLDVLGHCAHSEITQFKDGNATLSVTGLNAGLYQIFTIYEGHVYTGKLVKI